MSGLVCSSCGLLSHWLDKPHRGLDGGSVSDGDKEGGQADVAGTALVAPLEGVRHLLRGFRLLLAPGVKRFVVIPLAINAVLFAVALVLGAAAVAELVGYLQGMLPGWLDWIALLAWPLYVVAGLLVIFFAAGMVANLIAAPFMKPLAAAVEHHLTGEVPPRRLRTVRAVVLDIPGSVGSELAKLVCFLLRALPLLLLFLIPGVNALAPFAWLIFGAWMLAREYLDPPLTNHGYSFRDQGRLIARHRTGTLGFGGAAAVANTIPGVNFFVLPAAVAGGASLVSARMRDPLRSAA
ncbi:sulfate transporter CysZ [Halorhodospira halophila]|nr:sulfate transporter CysZ [Halorhodospira halophila]